jgi:hypothetical protein
MVGGTYQVKPPFPFTPGLEAAGEVIETGSGVMGLRSSEPDPGHVWSRDSRISAPRITDGRDLLLTSYTEPEPELNLLLKKLKLELPTQPPKDHRRARATDPAVVPIFKGSASAISTTQAF